MEENKKKKILKITLCTLGLILVLAIGSLAVYNASIPGTALNKLLVSQPDFKFNFTESNTVTMNNPSNNDKQDFNFNVMASSTDTNYMFSIDYTVYLKVNENNTISNDLVYVELYDKNNNKLVDKTKLSDLTKVTGKDNEYVLKTNNIQIFNESKTYDYVLRYSYVNNAKTEYSKDDTSQTGTYKSSGTFNMTVNVSMNRFDYGKINSLSITTPPSKIEYNEGESFDKTGMIVKANLNNNKSYEIKDYTISPSGALTTSNKEVTISYGGKSVKQSISVKAFNLDNSGANVPTLTSNMIPVYYDSTSNVWKKASTTKDDTSNKWYDYDNKMWANAVTVSETNRQTYLNADAGTTIPMSDINTMWVWVPRYKYTMLNTCADIKNPTEEANPSCYGYVYKDEYYNRITQNLISRYGISERGADDVILAWKNGKKDAYLEITFAVYANPDNGYTELTFDKSFISTNVGEQSFNIKFESGKNSTGTIKCTDAVTGTSSTSETCTDTTNGGLKAGTSTYTHPAFWWDKNDNNVREEGEELTGIWVGKFEVSSDTTCTASSNAAVGSGCNLQTIRPQIKPNVTSWRGAQIGTFFNGIQKMRESGNQYGFSTTDETHMMKNMEWGAVAYLSHSKYGINKEVAINSANTFTTGCGPQSEGSISYGATCNSYTTTLGQSASTTGNVYGVYDMSGGAFQYMMGNMVWTNGQQMSGSSTTNNTNSAFTEILYGGTSFTGTYAFPSKRYYDKYSYGTSEKEYTRGKLGDATKEMAPTGTTGNWYSDYAYFVYSHSPWVLRGGTYNKGSNAGAFGFNYGNGVASTEYSARAVLSGTLD